VFPNAVHLSDVTYFWDIATKMKKSPWGITANMAVKNSRLRFDTRFIKTGGGEDIDYCLQLQKWPLLCVPNAKVIHPWWHGGDRCYGHFYRWAVGDSNLIDKYPKLTYRNWPNVWEMTLILLILMPLLGIQQLLLCLLGIWLADIVMDIGRNMFSEQRYKQHSQVKGWVRFIASLESNIVKNSCELGHLLGPLSRGKISYITKRFDWFCGMLPEVIPNERKRNLSRFVVFMSIVCAVVMHAT
jgi:hypothetical protein